MRRPHPKETELHEKYSKLSQQELIVLEEFLRKSANASYQGGARNAKQLEVKYNIVKYYMNNI